MGEAMTRAFATFWLGLLLSIASLTGLLFVEGAFFDSKLPETGGMVHPMECRLPPPRQPEVKVDVEIPKVALFAQTADLHLQIDFAPFVEADCAWVKIGFFAPFEMTRGTGHYDIGEKPGYPRENKSWIVFLRNAQPKTFRGGSETARFVLPGFFKRTEIDSFAARLGIAGRSTLTAARAFGETGAVFDHEGEYDVVYSFAEYSRIGRIAAIVLSALLGIGVSAMFEALLVGAALRRIDAAAAAAAASRAGSGGEGGGAAGGA